MKDLLSPSSEITNNCILRMNDRAVLMHGVQWRHWRHSRHTLPCWRYTWCEQKQKLNSEKYNFKVIVYFDWCIIPHTTAVCHHTRVYDVTLRQQVYLQHGGGNYCW